MNSPSFLWLAFPLQLCPCCLPDFRPFYNWSVTLLRDIANSFPSLLVMMFLMCYRVFPNLHS